MQSRCKEDCLIRSPSLCSGDLSVFNHRGWREEVRQTQCLHPIVLAFCPAASKEQDIICGCKFCADPPHITHIEQRTVCSLSFISFILVMWLGVSRKTNLLFFKKDNYMPKYIAYLLQFTKNLTHQHEFKFKSSNKSRISFHNPNTKPTPEHKRSKGAAGAMRTRASQYRDSPKSGVFWAIPSNSFLSTPCTSLAQAKAFLLTKAGWKSTSQDANSTDPHQQRKVLSRRQPMLTTRSWCWRGIFQKLSPWRMGQKAHSAAKVGRKSCLSLAFSSCATTKKLLPWSQIFSRL